MSEIDDILKGAPAYKPGATSNPSNGASTPVESEIDAALKDAPSTARGVGGLAKDFGAWALKGAVAVPEAVVGLADIPTGGAVGKFLENEDGMVGFRPKRANEAINEWHTDATKEAQRKFQQAEGFGGKFMAAVENPSNIVGSVIESAPSMFAGGLVGRGLLGATRLGQMGAKGAALAGSAGEGVMSAGSAAEQMRQETADGRLTPEQSAAAAATGLATAGFGALGGKIANKLRIGDVDTMLAQGNAGIAKQFAYKAAGASVNNIVQQQAAKSIPRQVIEGAISEGLLEELPQSVSEQVIQNLALGKPWHEDVDTSAVMGVLSGGAMGAGAAGYQGFLSRGEPAQTPGHPPQTPPTEPDQPYTGPTLALPAPPQGTIEVGSDGTARTPEYQRPRYVGDMAGDITDVMPKPEGVQTTAHVDPVRQSVQQAADAGGALSSAALTAIDSGAAQAAQPATAYEPPVISLEEADAIDQAAYEQFFASMDADPVVGRYLEDDNDIPDFGAASNTSDEDFLRAMGATDEEINDAIATTRQSAIQASRAAGDAGPQAYEPAGTRQGAGTDQAGQEAQVNAAIQPLAAATPVPTLGGSVGADGAAGTAPAVSDGLSAGGPRNGGAAAAGIGASESGAARPGGRGDGNQALTPLQQARAEIQARKQQEAANAKASQTQAPAAAPVPGAATSAPMEADGRAPDIKAIAAKQIQDMTDVELQQAITHYGPEHKRTAKLQKETQRRALQPESTPGVNLVPQANQTKQATTQPAQTGAAPAASSDSAAQGAAAGAAPVGSGEPTTELTNAAANQDAGAQGTSVANWKSLTPDQRRRETLEQEIATGKTNNGGVIANLRPSAIEARKQELAAMGERGRLQGPAAPAPRKLPPKLAQKAAQVEAQRADYFTPGNVVPSYGGGHDRVVSYTPGDAQGNWNVRVQAVRQENGAWVNVPREGERIHATQPDARELKAGPVVRAPAAQAAPVEVKQNNAEAQQDKAPAAIINVQAGAAQPTQGLTDAATAQNPGAQAAPQTGAQRQAPGAEPEFTTLKTVDGYTVTVRTSDLNSDKPRLRQYTKNGKSKAVPAIARDNLDPTGEKRAAQAAEVASNPFFNVITAKNGNAFASQSAAARELNRVGMGATHEVVQADSVQPGVQGFLIRRKQGEAIEPSGQAAQAQMAVGRAGYDTPVELDARALKRIIEQNRGEPLVDKPAKLQAWRDGTAKTDPVKFPIELAITPDGRLDVNDGRHRIALAAERGEKVTAFIDGKNAQRAIEIAGTDKAGAPAPVAITQAPAGAPVATDQAPTSETAQPKAVVAAQPAPPSTPSKPVPNPAALQRIAEGKAYFFSRDKADAFVADNALADGYEVVQDNKRFVVQAKKPATTAGVAQQATDAATQEQGGDNNTPANEREESSKPAAPAQQPADTDLASIFERLDRRGRMKSAAEAEAKAHPRAEQIATVQDQFHDILLALMEQGKLEVNGQKSLTEDNKSCL